jgi:uncharacterized protein YbaP (TraB family)
MRKKIFLLAVLSVCVAVISEAQQVKKLSKKPVAKQRVAVPLKLENSLLWEISGNTLSQPSYLFGTMHILCAEDAVLSDALKSAIERSDKICFEIDLDDAGQLMSSLKFLRMNDGQKISELLSPGDYSRVKDYIDAHKFPLPLSMMNRFKPYFVSSLIGERMMDCANTKGMEQQIMAESSKYNKEIMGLETIEFQASIFDSIPYEKQAKELVTYIDSIDSYKAVTAQMMDYYKKEDLNKLNELLVKSDPGMESYMDLLLYNRNRSWIDPMQSQMFLQSTLFAVGAGHLGGDKGIISLLRQKGFTVKPIKTAGTIAPAGKRT